jgi:hypothetical protein
MTNPRFNVGVASTDRRMFDIVVPNVGKRSIHQIAGPTAGREGERERLAKLHGKQLERGSDKCDLRVLIADFRRALPDSV